MPTPLQLTCLLAYRDAAVAAEHIYPAMAACEAVLESAWGHSSLAYRYNNIFGQKQSTHPVFGNVVLPTQEFLDGKWAEVQARFVRFPDVRTCFRARWLLLNKLAPHYPHYANALAATTPEEYVTEVSQSWSTSPTRARDCIAIYQDHKDLLLAPANPTETA